MINYQDAWQAAQNENAAPGAEGTAREPLPVGVYTTNLENVETKVNKRGGEDLVFTFKVTDGDYAGRLLWRNVPQDLDWGPGAAMKDLKTLALDGSKITGVAALVTALQPVVGKALKVYVSQKEVNGTIYNNSHINGYFNAAEAVTAAPATMAPPAVDNDEEIPL